MALEWEQLNERGDRARAQAFAYDASEIPPFSQAELRDFLEEMDARVVVRQAERRVEVVLRGGDEIRLARAWLCMMDALAEIEFEFRLNLGAEPKESEQVAHEALTSSVISAAVRLLLAREPGLVPAFVNANFLYSPPGAIVMQLATMADVLQSRRTHEKLAYFLGALTGRKWTVRFEQMAEQRALVEAFRQVVDDQAYEKGIAQVNAPVATVKDKMSTGKDRGSPIDSTLRYGSDIAEESMNISLVQDEMRRCVIAGRVFGFESRDLPSGRQLISFHVSDDSDSLTCKLFGKTGKKESELPNIVDGMYVKVRGTVQFDTFSKELVLMVSDLIPVPRPVVADEAIDKRVELHAHTQMSALDGVISATDLVKQAAAYGHAAVAITDHGVVQSYPEAYAAGKKHGVKILYGLEANLIDVGQTIVYQPRSRVLDDSTVYVIFDTETTGLSAAHCELIEIAGVKMQGGVIIDRFAELIAPMTPIPAKITEITNITNDMVAGAPSVQEVLPKFRTFCEGSVMVAHNAEFDLAFLRVQASCCGVKPFDEVVIDTLALARTLYPNDRNHKLKTLTQKFEVKLFEHHRALADAEATGRIYYKLLQEAANAAGESSIDALIRLGTESADYTRSRPVHATILVRDQSGLKNLYKMVSRSHLDFYHREPRIPRALLGELRAGLFVGSGCKYGELIQGIIRGKTREELLAMMQFYDFVELQPIDHYQALIDSQEFAHVGAVIAAHKTLLELADELGKPVVATGDVHFLRPQDALFREIILYTVQNKGDSKNPVKQPNLSFRTTHDMLQAFSHLDQRASEIVIDNPRKLADLIETVRPVPDGVFPPIMEGAEDQVRTMSWEKAKALYGDPVPDVVRERLDKELHSIITYGFSVNYLIAHKLVTKSLQDGYIVGSRGSVGSSLVATMLDITEVNPLAPHYRCTRCQYSEFILDGSVGSGFDLPDRECPKCQQALAKDGQDIPFETFLGFKGDKVPDIDLNFSGEYQARAHKYTEELFGSDYVYRAGTISTIADKTAFGYVRRWADDHGRQLRNAEIARLVNGCTGIKRTTGQHPGGLIIVPNDREIYDFCPIQHPADDKKSETRTTHFDFNSIHDNLLKLDILGHDDPTVLRMLQDITGIPVQSVPVDDRKVYALFRSVEPLGVSEKEIRSRTGTYGIPEMGTRFVRQMLEEAQPQNFADLVRISGLSHGTDVWTNNAQELIKGKVAKLQEVICCRDDIMVYLIYRGLEPSRAFKIMESVRKGKGLTEEDEAYMKSFDVPEWYLESCRRIQYMFPKAHAAAYVLNAVRIAWFKVHKPLAYYAAYFTVRAEDFDLALMARGADVIAARIEEIESKGNTATPKEKALQTVLELALEMTRRGFHFKTLDLYRSDATRFLVDGDGLLPPFSAATGVGEAAARGIVQARMEAPFISKEDVSERAHVSKTVIELLDSFGCLVELPDTNQLTLF
ncbi:MAG: PolC-type DNA polymerase III [Firmicutes bacterium]|nr:PolC-type DNA polymerase III [Bacillota bacterium]